MSSKSQKGVPNDRPKATKDQGSTPSRLPFEPGQNRKKSSKQAAPASTPQPESKPTSSPQPGKASKPTSASASASRQATAIPEAVSQRMVRRVAFFSGLPTMLGMLTFVFSYFIVKNHLFPLPHVAVVLVSMGFFGLGVLGLSYGALSASWDEARLGSWHGWQEFTTNLARLLESWRSLRQKPDS